MAACGAMIEGNVVAFACDLDSGHEGPHRAVENARSVRERRVWEEQQAAQREAEARHQASGLAQFQGRAQTTAEAYTENPTVHPGVVPAEDLHPMQCQTHVIQDGKCLGCLRSASEVIGQPVIELQRTPQPQGTTDATEGIHIGLPPSEQEVEVDPEIEAYAAHPIVWTEDGTSGMGEFRPASIAEARVAGFDLAPQVEPTKQRPGDQVLPTPTGEEYVQDRIIAKTRLAIEQGVMDPQQGEQIIAQMEQSKQVGAERYGTPLQTFNGRDTLQDAAEEARDLYVYLNSLIQAREAQREGLVNAVLDAWTTAQPGWRREDAQGWAEIAVDALTRGRGPLAEPPVEGC